MEKEREFYSKIYKNKDYYHGLERVRIDQIIKRIPSCSSVLEIGCGDGRILNRISIDYKVGVDFALKPLSYVKSLVYAANVKSLPFLDNSFELIICTEVLEHLDYETYKMTLEEISRVSSRFILISVPYKENLKKRIAFCTKCNHLFHGSLHFRTFNENILKNLDKSSKIIFLEKFGFKSYFPDFFNKLKILTGNYFTKRDLICPYCGEKNLYKKDNIFGRIFSFLNLLLKHILFFYRIKKPIWILGIFEKLNTRASKPKNILICPICRKTLLKNENYFKCLEDHEFFYNNNILDLSID